MSEKPSNTPRHTLVAHPPPPPLTPTDGRVPYIGRVPRTESDPAECECWNWCSDGLHRRVELLAGHHYRCPQFETEFRRRAMELIERLRDNMRDWGNEEDGVPDFAWKAFCDAEAVAGPTKAAKAGREAK